METVRYLLGRHGRMQRPSMFFAFPRFRQAVRGAICSIGFALLLGASVCSAAARGAPPAWTEVRTAHFTVATDAGEKEGRRVLDQLERMRAVFQSLLPGAQVDSAEPVVVLAVRNEREFLPLEPASWQGKGQLRVSGYALRATDRNYVLLRLDAHNEQHPWATVYHEYTHIELGDAEHWLPLWLNEGLAEFFQNTGIAEHSARLGQTDATALALLQQHLLIPLPQLLRMNAGSSSYHDEQLGTVFYAECWALTHFLEAGDLSGHTHRVLDYMRRVSAHEDPVIAAQETFGDLHRLESDLKTYIAPGHHQYFTLEIPLAAADPGPVAIRALPPVETDVLRADLLAHNGRREDALALLRPALAADPKNVAAEETMGFLALRQGDEREAAHWYGEAARTGSQHFLTWYYAAVLAANNDEAGAQIEETFRTAIRLNPRFAPAYDGLAEYECLHEEHLDEAQKLEGTAADLDPVNLTYRVHMADILAAQRDFSGAREKLRAAAAEARSLEESALIERHQQRVQLLEKQMLQQQRERAENEARLSTWQQASGPSPEPRHTTEKPHGRMHYVHGVLHHVTCTDPLSMELQLESGNRRLSLYTNDWSTTQYEVANFTPRGDIHPCVELEGMRAEVEYFATADKSVDGQIVAILLFK